MERLNRYRLTPRIFVEINVRSTYNVDINGEEANTSGKPVLPGKPYNRRHEMYSELNRRIFLVK